MASPVHSESWAVAMFAQLWIRRSNDWFECVQDTRRSTVLRKTLDGILHLCPFGCRKFFAQFDRSLMKISSGFEAAGAQGSLKLKGCCQVCMITSASPC